jgi:protein-tyrosine phosphatase
VGGLPAGDGRAIRHDALYRSDAPLPGDRPPYGLRWPPRSIIDLRSSDELDGAHPLAGPDTVVVPHPLFARASVEHMIDEPEDLPDDLAALYRQLLAVAPSRLVDAVTLIANRPGPTLVHCTAGKDRTGLVVALALAAVGVPRGHIIADYRRTATNMPGVLARVVSEHASAGTVKAVRDLAVRRPDMLDAPAFAIAAALDELAGAGGAERWLLGAGLPPATLDALRARLLDGRRS